MLSGKCHCDVLHTGPDCGSQKCPAADGMFVEEGHPAACHGRGTCRKGVCTCQPSFHGSSCELVHCPADCSGRGTCQPTTGVCNCDDGYEGEACLQRECPDDCNGNGLCDKLSGKCQCDSGFSGPACEADSFCESTVANWWESFNHEGWSSCPLATLLTGLYRSDEDCEGLHCIEMARCSVPCKGEQAINIGECYHADWTSSMSARCELCLLIPSHHVYSVCTCSNSVLMAVGGRAVPLGTTWRASGVRNASLCTACSMPSAAPSTMPNTTDATLSPGKAL